MELNQKSCDANTGDSDDEENNVELENIHMQDTKYKYESSIYSSDSDGSESHRLTPVPDDANSKQLKI